MDAALRPVVLLAKGLLLPLAVLVTSTFVVPLLVNLFDEPLSVEAQRVLAPIEADTRDDNGYVHLVAVMAPGGADSLGFAREWIAAYGNAETRAAIESANARFANPLEFAGNKEALCKPETERCLPLVAQRAQVWREMRAANAELIERAQKMVACPRFEDAMAIRRLDTPFPKYTTDAHLLLLDLIALDAQEGRLDAALGALEKRIAFHRNMLAGSRNLLGGMIAAAWLRRDHALLGEIVAAHPEKLGAYRARLLTMTEPLTLAETRAAMKHYLAGETALGVSGMTAAMLEKPDTQEPEVPGSWIAQSVKRLLFKPNATANAYVENMLGFAQQIDAYEPSRIESFMASAAASSQARMDAHFYLTIGYNPIGKTLGLIGLPDFSQYLIRLSDLVAITRLARLQVLVALEDPTADVSTVLAQDESLHDPYTAQPMQWDGLTRRIGVDLKANPSKNRPPRFELSLQPVSRSPIAHPGNP